MRRLFRGPLRVVGIAQALGQPGVRSQCARVRRTSARIQHLERLALQRHRFVATSLACQQMRQYLTAGRHASMLLPNDES